MAERILRSDAGTVKVTERDQHAFAWLADMKAIFESDLRVLLGRWRGELASPDATRQTVNRWRRAGWAQAQQLQVGQSRVVRLMPGGAQVVGHEEGYAQPALWTSLHAAMVSRTRLWLEAGAPGAPELSWSGVAEWESERRIRDRLQADRGPKALRGVHVPDGIITTTKGSRIARALERTEKNAARLEPIVEQLTNPATGYPVTLYVTDRPNIARHVEAAYQRVLKRNPGSHQLVAVQYPKELEA